MRSKAACSWWSPPGSESLLNASALSRYSRSLMLSFLDSPIIPSAHVLAHTCSWPTGSGRCGYSPNCVEGVSLLKKSSWDQSVVQSRIQILRHQGQNTANGGVFESLKVLGRGVEGFFNSLGCSANFALTAFSKVHELGFLG